MIPGHIGTWEEEGGYFKNCQSIFKNLSGIEKNWEQKISRGPDDQPVKPRGGGLENSVERILKISKQELRINSQQLKMNEKY